MNGFVWKQTSPKFRGLMPLLNGNLIGIPPWKLQCFLRFHRTEIEHAATAALPSLLRAEASLPLVFGCSFQFQDFSYEKFGMPKTLILMECFVQKNIWWGIPLYDNPGKHVFGASSFHMNPCLMGSSSKNITQKITKKITSIAEKIIKKQDARYSLFENRSPHLPVDLPPLPAWSVAPGCGSIVLQSEWI